VLKFQLNCASFQAGEASANFGGKVQQEERRQLKTKQSILSNNSASASQTQMPYSNRWVIFRWYAVHQRCGM